MKRLNNFALQKFVILQNYYKFGSFGGSGSKWEIQASFAPQSTLLQITYFVSESHRAQKETQ